jgi:phosphate starvation-inducible PhoH-like protein
LLFDKGGTQLSRRRKSFERSTSDFTKFEQIDNTVVIERKPKKPILLVPKTLTQEKYILALNNPQKQIVVAYGPAGTGKSYLGMLSAIRALKMGETDRIVITRPAVGVEEEQHGFLPGDLNQKMAPWTRPLFDIMREHYHPREITKMLEDEIVEIAPLAFMRGRSFKNTWIVADELQNSTTNQAKMLFTRIGENCKLIVTGDLNQKDRKFSTDNGLADFIERAKKSNCNRVALVEYSIRDVQRDPIVSEVLKMYGE